MKPLHKVQIVFNNTNWATAQQKAEAIKAFFAPILTMQIDILLTAFSYIPFTPTTGSDGSSGIETIIQTQAVDPTWYKENVSANGLGYNQTLFYVEGKNTIGHIYPTGIRQGNDVGPVALTLFGINENDHAYQSVSGQEVDLGNSFVIFACHEICHGLCFLLGIPDNVHKFFYSANPAGILSELVVSQMSWWQVTLAGAARALNYLLTKIQMRLPSQVNSTGAVSGAGPVQGTASTIPPHVSKIPSWANAIAKWEGSKPELNNPGNLKLSTLTASWGGKQGPAGEDGGYFAQFATYELGFTALTNFLTLLCQDELKAFHQARTFQAATAIYAGNPPEGYIDGVAALVPCQLMDDVSTFL